MSSVVLRWPGGEVEALVAGHWHARLAGLLVGPPRVLLFPRTRAVHSVGMRYALDLVFIGSAERVLRVIHGLRPGRAAWCWSATEVVEVPAQFAITLPRAGDPIERRSRT